MVTLPAMVNHQNAKDVRDAGILHIKNHEKSIDASMLEEFDSSILAILLAWFRVSSDIEVHGFSEKLQVLAKVHGLDELLTLKVPQ
jgi:ABC-type transporter Mla MlaB component